MKIEFKACFCETGCGEALAGEVSIIWKVEPMD